MYGIIFNSFGTYTFPNAERPSGGYRIATHLRRLGWDVEVIDYFAYFSIEKIASIISDRHKRFGIKWIGISSTWLIGNPVHTALIRHIKVVYPEIKVIIGGNAPMTLDAGADYYIYGFGERAIEAVLKYEFSNGMKPYGKPFYKGWFVDALTFYPAWPMEDYLNEYEERDFIVPSDVLSVEIGRGCRFKCKFCNFPVLGLKEDTSMSEEVIYNYFSSLYDKWGVTSFTLADETINERVSKLEKIASAVERLNFKPNITAFVRIDLLHSHPEMIELLARARIWGHFYGIETFNHSTGKIIGKGLDPNIVKHLMLKIKDYNLTNLGRYRGTASFISGLPNETFESLKATHDWLIENWSDQSWIFFTLSIPDGGDYKMSAFGEDLSKYGYRPIPADKTKEYIRLDKNPRGAVGLDFVNIVYWENNIGNYFKFKNAAIKYSLNNGEHVKLGNFKVFEKLSLGINIEKALTLKNQENINVHEQLLYKRVNQYVEKKLNYYK